MSRTTCLFLLVALAVCWLAITASAGAPPPMTENLEWKGRVIVEFRDELGAINPTKDSEIALLGEPGLDALARQFNVYHMEMLIPGAQKPTDPRLGDLSRFYVLMFPLEIDLHEVASAYAQNPLVKTSEPYYIRKCDYVPSDPYWNNQWHLNTVHAAIAYDYCRGDSTVIVGIVDSGIDTQHVDLRDNLWINPGEDLNHNGIIEPSEWDNIDNERNGYIDDFYGWNVWQGNNNVQDPPTAGHGTHCAGCASAVTDNAVGVASLGFKAKIMVARAGDGQYIYASAAGINYCANNGADAISLSYGGPSYQASEQLAVNNAWALGVAVFASAGNENSIYYHYPGAYDNVVCVASTNEYDQKSSFSNYGTWVDVCAPGELIYSTIPGNSYAAWNGTSFSCPITAGLACLIKAASPSFTNAQIIQQIYDTCVNIDSLNPQYVGLLGHGRIDAGAAISSLFPNLIFTETLLSDTSYGNSNGRPDPGETIEVFFSVANENPAVAGNQVAVTLTCVDPDITILQGSVDFTTIPGGATVNNNANPLTFSVNSLAQPHEATFVLTLTEPSLITPIVTQLVQMIGRPEVIVIDDDGGANYQQYYDGDLDALQVVHDIWNTTANGDISQSELMLYPTVIWHTSNTDDPLSSSEQSLISYYLSHGGRLFLTGEDIDEQLHATAFYTDILHATSLQSNGAPQLTGVEGDPISGGTTLLLVGGGGAQNSLSPSTISPAGLAAQVYTYTSSGLGAGIRWDDIHGMLVYFAFNFEAASGIGSTPRQTVLNNILLWFNTFSVKPLAEKDLPTTYALQQNYPNPFNPGTEITFALPKEDFVRLGVFDLSGKLVAILANDRLPAGEHKLLFRADDLASGIYLYRLEAGNAAFTRKMILLK